MIDRNHPAVEAALDAEARTDGPMSRDTAHYMLERALPHLTTATEENLARLRNTEAGRALMAEAWDEGKTDAHYWWEMGGPWRAEITITNPYKETPNE